MRWNVTPKIGEIRERIIFLWLPKRFYRRSRNFYFEDNGESVVLWLESVYVVERWSYANDISSRSTNNSKCYWRTEAWRVLK